MPDDYAMIRSKQLFLRARIELAAELVVIGYAKSVLDDGIEKDATGRFPKKYEWIDRLLNGLKPCLAPKFYKLGLAADDELDEQDEEEGDDDEWVGRALDQEKRTQKAVDNSRIVLERTIVTLQDSMDTRMKKMEDRFDQLETLILKFHR